jgi:putative oxidoreductase
MTRLHEIAGNQPAPRLRSIGASPERNLKPMTRFDTFLASMAGPAQSLLRLVAGLLFAFHGMQGLSGYQIPAEYIPKFGSQGWFGSVIELATGLLVAGGFLTRWASFLASGTMAVAYVQFHWKLQFGAQFFPAVNQGEMALVYCLVFFHFATRGPGRPSVDGILGRG